MRSELQINRRCQETDYECPIPWDPDLDLSHWFRKEEEEEDQRTPRGEGTKRYSHVLPKAPAFAKKSVVGKQMENSHM